MSVVNRASPWNQPHRSFDLRASYDVKGASGRQWNLPTMTVTTAPYQLNGLDNRGKSAATNEPTKRGEGAAAAEAQNKIRRYQ